MRPLLIIGLLVLTGCSQSPEQQVVKRVEHLLREGHALEALALVEGQAGAELPPALREWEFLLRLRLEQLEAAAQTWNTLPNPPDALARALRHRDAEIRKLAARLAADHPRAVSLRSLCRTANDPVSEVRGFAVRALGKRGDTAAFKQLFRGLHDSDWRVRAAAADALAQLDDPTAIKWLIPALEDPDGFVRYRAASALCAVTTAANMEKLREICPRLTARQQTYLAVAMAQQRDPHGEEILLRAADSADEELRQAAATALRMYRTSAAGEALRELSRDSSPKVRQQAAASLEARAREGTAP